MHFTSSILAQLPNIVHGFGTRDEPVPAPLQERWEEAKPIWRQTHESNSAEVQQPHQLCGEVDALFTSQFQLPIGVVTADCVPILLASRSGRGIAVVHAGWRGTKARILQTLWKKLMERGEHPTDWVAAVGPSIGPCCYEVSAELADEFSQEFSSYGAALAVPTSRRLDLPAINAAELRALGLAEVDLLRACTRCSFSAGNPLFHSYRREGGGTRQYSLLMRKNADT